MTDLKCTVSDVAVRHIFWRLAVIIAGFLLGGLAAPMECAYAYDSSIQRSNFTTNPRYLRDLEEQISHRRAQFLWKLRFDAQSLETDDNIQSQLAGATFGLRFRYKIIDSVELRAKANLTLESGRSQDLFGDQEPGSGIYPREFLLRWGLYQDFVSIDTGLIQQTLSQSDPLFISNLAFPGVAENFEYRWGRNSIGLYLQQTIPSSYTRSARVAEREDIPYYYTETLKAMLGWNKFGFITGEVSHFRYENLPAIVAFDSFLYGNTVLAPDQTNGRFLYGFDGFRTRLGGEQKFSRNLAGQLFWTTIINNAAPSDAGESQSFYGSLSYDVGRWIVSGHYRNFFIESDAVPGSYNSHLLGHNNRIGNAYSFDLESKDWGVRFRGQFVQSDLLNESNIRVDGIQQNNQQSFYFSVETSYDFI